MSFGYEVGDIILVTQLAWRCVQNTRDACGEHDELTRAVGGLHSVLCQFQLSIHDQESLNDPATDDQNDDVKLLVSNCEEVLSKLDSILRKYSTLGESKHSKGKKVWQKVKFGNNEMQNLTLLRQKMIAHTQNLTFYYMMVSQRRVEKAMRCAGGDISELKSAGMKNQEVETMKGLLAQILVNTQKPDGTVLTSYSDDDPTTWKKFRRLLIAEGFKSSIVEENFEDIMAYVRELGNRGDLDDHCEARSDIHRQVEFEAHGKAPIEILWQEDFGKLLEATSLESSHSQPSAGFMEELLLVTRMHGVPNMHSLDITPKSSNPGRALSQAQSYKTRDSQAFSPTVQNLQNDTPLELDCVNELKIELEDHMVPTTEDNQETMAEGMVVLSSNSTGHSQSKPHLQQQVSIASNIRARPRLQGQIIEQIKTGDRLRQLWPLKSHLHNRQYSVKYASLFHCRILDADVKQHHCPS